MHVQASFLIVALSAIFTVTDGLPTSDLTARAKIGGGPARPPPPPPPPANPPANHPPPPQQPAPSTCNGIKDGNTCVTCAKNPQCGFNAQTKVCVARAGGANLVTDPSRCQQSSATDSDTIRQRADAIWTQMRNHIFNGETTSSTSGRHTFSAWRAANRDAGRCDTDTNLCAFRLNSNTPKTVWDDRAGKYNAGDVESMCKTAITLNIKDSGGRATRDGAFVVQTKFGKPICVRHQVAGSGSCFPVGLHSRTNALGSTCSEGPQDTQAIQGKNAEVPPA